MITAIIRNKENTLVLELPHSIYDIYEKLRSIGITANGVISNLTVISPSGFSITAYPFSTVKSASISNDAHQPGILTQSFFTFFALSRITLLFGKSVVCDMCISPIFASEPAN